MRLGYGLEAERIFAGIMNNLKDGRRGRHEQKVQSELGAFEF